MTTKKTAKPVDNTVIMFSRDGAESFVGFTTLIARLTAKQYSFSVDHRKDGITVVTIVGALLDQKQLATLVNPDLVLELTQVLKDLLDQ